jgi:hypothetical protein
MVQICAVPQLNTRISGNQDLVPLVFPRHALVLDTAELSAHLEVTRILIIDY